MTDNALIDARAMFVKLRESREETAAREERHRQGLLRMAERERGGGHLRLIELEAEARRTGYRNFIRIVS